MASLRINPSVPLGTFDKIGTTQTRLTVSMHKNDMMQRKPLGVCASLSLSNPLPSDRVLKNDPKKEATILSRNLDEWMKVSMVDIVKNLKQAPLFVHIYANENDKGQERQPQIKTERALVEKWPIMKSEWESGKSRTPDGLIFVDELGDEELEELNENSVEDSEEGLTKSWGVVVQGKGVEFGPACYLLKTSRVRAGRGMGLFCTHFCLVRVTNFRESALKQFKGCWL
ncbi:uncharacterized protein LOC132639196 [Lycium barbarum]|uniref:uncharacterized protein LOC132639196 n=1 Tax=Lycium barbarum TaxID=112863 RepID=UPI00293E025D|nr:uncharacterized protein LOC132639196 [Lycium barbarum]